MCHKSAVTFDWIYNKSIAYIETECFTLKTYSFLMRANIDIKLVSLKCNFHTNVSFLELRMISLSSNISACEGISDMQQFVGAAKKFQ